MKAHRFNFYRDGMEPEPSGMWILVNDLPAEVREQFVEARVQVGKPDDDDEDDDQ